MQTTVNERLKILFAALDMRPSQMARLLGISPSTLHNYTDRESKPGYEVLEKLYSSFEEINLKWLFTGRGEPLLSGAAEDSAISQTNKKISRSQVIGHVAGNVSQQQGTLTSELAAAQREIELLRAQLADKERTIQILLKQL